MDTAITEFGGRRKRTRAFVLAKNNGKGEIEMKFINIGFGNMVSAGRIVAIASPDSEPIKRLVRDSKEDGRVIDVSCGRRTRSVLIMDSEHVILSAIQTETITNRLSSDDDTADDEDEE